MWVCVQKYGLRVVLRTRHAITPMGITFFSAEMLLPLEKARRIEILLLQKLDI